MPAFTLHQGANQAAFIEHPVEAARRALEAAAEVESDREWCGLMLSFARSLPDRRPLRRAESGLGREQPRKDTK